MADKLTPKQEAYVQGLFKGLSQREAYKQAGYSTQNMTDNSLDREACVLAKKPKISQRLKELQSAVVEKNILSREQLLEALTGAIQTAQAHLITTKYFGTYATKQVDSVDSGAISAMTGAINEINKMCGWHAPKKIDASVTSDKQQQLSEYLEAIKNGKLTKEK